ncbi:MAG TPA: cysteine desulfurase [Dehalococcoidia bacterium]|nr:cysteine desulfurase [Dehalococcoidia bacterium]
MNHVLDTDRVRTDFPILSETVNGRPLVYLDNAATTQKPRAVIDALVHYYEHDNANIHRGLHALAVRATEQYEAVRAKVARFVGAASPESIIFTRNTTEALNLIAYTWGAALDEGDEIVLSVMEHHSNIVPWQLLAERTGAIVRAVDIREDGQLDLDAMRDSIGPRTKLVTIAHVSNVLGTINPVAEISAMAHEAGALVCLDGAQSVPHMPVNIGQTGCDFYAFSAHKMLGPTGVGVLWARPEILETIEPFLGGGDMISTVKLEGSSWAEFPHKFEAGTPNIADVIAFGAAIDYLDELGMTAVREHECRLTEYLLEVMNKISWLRPFGPKDAEHRGGVISFEVEGVHPHDVATIVDGHGVAIRAGHHCAQPLMRRLQVPATNRVSFAVYNNEREVDIFLEALDHVRSVFADDRPRTTI